MPTYKNAADENTELFGWWLDGQLSEQQRQQFEQRCVDDPSFAGQVETANMMNMQAESYRPQNVPQWDRLSTFDSVEKSKWWQWQGLSSLSFVVSSLAIVMVLSGMQIRMDDGAMTISFAAKQSSQEIDRLVEDRLREFQQNQQLVLNNYTQIMQQQQLDASTQLTSYLLNSSRQERREDFAELIKFVNEQRLDDQTFYARQLNKLQQDIYTNPGSLGLDNINE
ncbi:MAG: hypothetical protein ACI88A_001396 [Paraglaciecola sp.]|jgi:hypothetical protein